MEGERKHVTVLFADLKDSLALLLERDPEEARSILDPVLDLMMEAVHHYEGTVNQVMGDGIMALFGAPLAHEDHAVRACYAALHMQARVQRHAETVRSRGVPVRIRIGLNSGEVLVRSISSDLRMDYSAVGATTHLAARMEQMAEPGWILATANTRRLAEGYVEMSSLGARLVRGLEMPIEVYAVTGFGTARSRLELGTRHGLSDFVGRGAELTQLGRALQAAAAGRGQVVGLVGEPGVGKSRLVHEFARSDAMTGWLVLRAGAAAYDKGIAYRPIVQMLRSYFDLGRGEPDDVAASVMKRIRALDANLIPDIPALTALLDESAVTTEWAGLDPRERRRRTMSAVMRLLLRESQDRPTCLILEDLHWIDFETQALLDDLIERLPAVRILLLLNYRPEYRHDWGSRTYYSQLRIDPLPRATAEELLHGLVGSDSTVAPLEPLLIDQTHGNPFYLEECVRALAEDGILVGQRGAYRLARPIATIRVPPTVQAVLAARIDRLAPSDKRILQCASVIGEIVPAALLEAVADVTERELPDGLARLRTAEFLYDASVVPEPGHLFRHGLTCRVAYDSLVRDRRLALHAAIAQTIERLYPDRIADHVEELAHHAYRGELWSSAARYLRQAAAKAFARSANHEAVGWYRQALDAVSRSPETADTLTGAADLHIGLRGALTLLGEHVEALSHLRQAEAIAERIGDGRRLGRALAFEVNALVLLGDHEGAIDAARRAHAVADSVGDVSLRTVTQIYAGRAHLYVGDFAEAIAVLTGVITTLAGELAYDHLGIPVLPSVFARSLLAECLAATGRFDESARYANEALALAARTTHPDTVLWAHHGAGVHHLVRGEVAEATRAFERAYALCQAHDMPAYRPRISAELALVRALGGHPEEAVGMVEQAVAEAAARRQATSHPQTLLLAAEVMLLAGRQDEAAEAATSALAEFRRQRAKGYEAAALWLIAEIAASRHSPASGTAQRYYEEGGSLARKLGMRPLLARCDLGLARVFITGRHDGARALLRSACTLFAALGMTADLARASAQLSALGDG